MATRATPTLDDDHCLCRPLKITKWASSVIECLACLGVTVHVYPVCRECSPTLACPDCAYVVDAPEQAALRASDGVGGEG